MKRNINIEYNIYWLLIDKVNCNITEITKKLIIIID